MNAKIALNTALAVAVLAAGAMAAEVSEKTDKELELKLPAQVSITHVVGKIDVRRRAGTKLEIHATKRVEASSEAEGKKLLARVEIRIEQKEGEVSIKTIYDKEGVWEKLKALFTGANLGKVAVDYLVSMPPGAGLDVATVAGSVDVTGLEAGAKVKGVSGPIRLSAIKGQIGVTAVSGEIVASDTDGPLSVNSVSGAIELGPLAAGPVAVNTVSGAVRAKLGPSKLLGASFTSVSGEVSVALSPGLGTDFSANTLSGKITTAPPLPSSGGAARWAAKLGGGGFPLSINTVSGSVTASESAATSVK